MQKPEKATKLKMLILPMCVLRYHIILEIKFGGKHMCKKENTVLRQNNLIHYEKMYLSDKMTNLSLMHISFFQSRL